MSEEMIIRHCAPTIAGLKTGNIFSCPYESKEQIVREIQAVNRKLAGKNLRMIPLRFSRKHVLIYLYRPGRLGEDLTKEESLEILKENGYSSDNENACLEILMRHLKEHLNEREPFPHEIGLFLSYPPADVKGFMEHKGADSMYTGTWKVYSDLDRALDTFASYKHCEQKMTSAYESGRHFWEMVR